MHSIRLHFPAWRLPRAVCSIPISRSLSSTAGELFVSGSSSTGQLGIASTSKTKAGLESVPLPELVSHVALGTSHALAVGVSGALYGWGGGASGQNGHGFNTQVDQPKLIKSAAGVRFIAVAAGKLHSLALSRCGTLFPELRTHIACYAMSKPHTQRLSLQ
jgi:alpha-tubulin suppressor-like RCC1 family protein